MRNNLLPALKKTKNVLPRSIYKPLVEPMLHKTLNLLFGSKGARVNIGGQGEFRFSPEYMFRGLENFGTGHNGGFSECIDACKGKKCFLDLGAHIGYYSLPASRVLAPGGCVYAFEPDTANYRMLKRHIGYNAIGNISVANVIVGDSTREGVPFFEHRDQGSPFGGLTVNRKLPKDNFRSVTKSQVSLDDFCAERNIVPDVIKIDVEGGELGVLRGASKVFAATDPVIFLSLHPSHLESLGHTTDEVIGIVRDLGYRTLALSGRGPWKPGSNECICVKGRDTVAASE